MLVVEKEQAAKQKQQSQILFAGLVLYSKLNNLKFLYCPRVIENDKLLLERARVLGKMTRSASFSKLLLNVALYYFRAD